MSSLNQPRGPHQLGPREELLQSALSLPVKVELAYRRAGIYTIGDLLSRDPYEYRVPIGPDPYWIEEVDEPTYGGGIRTHFYNRVLESAKSRGTRWPLEPWFDVKNIGVKSIEQTHAAIEEWRAKNWQMQEVTWRI